jgi:hypothetical protein
MMILKVNICDCVRYSKDSCRDELSNGEVRYELRRLYVVRIALILSESPLVHPSQ